MTIFRGKKNINNQKGLRFINVPLEISPVRGTLSANRLWRFTSNGISRPKVAAVPLRDKSPKATASQNARVSNWTAATPTEGGSLTGLSLTG